MNSFLTGLEGMKKAYLIDDRVIDLSKKYFYTKRTFHGFLK